MPLHFISLHSGQRENFTFILKHLMKKHSVISCFHMKIIYIHQNWVILCLLSLWELSLSVVIVPIISPLAFLVKKNYLCLMLVMRTVSEFRLFSLKYQLWCFHAVHHWQFVQTLQVQSLFYKIAIIILFISICFLWELTEIIYLKLSALLCHMVVLE